MGIKSNFNRFLRDMFPGVFERIHISEYSYKKIAVDVSLFLFKYKASCGDNWLGAFVNLICTFRKNKIHLVFIYDGKTPDEKILEQTKRREDKKKLQEDIFNIGEAIDKYEQSGIINGVLESFNKKITSDEIIDLEKIKFKFMQKSKQVINVCKNDFDLTKELCEVFDIPYFTANGEAEKLSSKLYLDGMVDAVLSDDTDVIAYGACSLSKFDSSYESCIRVHPETLLKELEFTKSQFLDFCIMCGTDYNNNVSGIGSVLAYKHIKNYGSIENLILNIKKDFSVLNHIRTRELFQSFDAETIKKIPYCKKPDTSKILLFLTENNIYYNLAKLDECKNVFIVD